MDKIYILCVDDESDVLRSVTRDLAELEDAFPIETAASADEADRQIDRVFERGDRVGLVLCDHVMPGRNGVDFLIELRKRPELELTRKVLFTGQAGHEDTVQAINRAGITHYVAKPWKREDLLAVARDELTDYVIDAGVDPLAYMKYLDKGRLAEHVHRQNRTHTGQ